MIKTKTLYRLKQDLQKVCNQYIRLRDTQLGYGKCISCGKFLAIGEGQAGHYISVKQSEALRFNEDNIHLQCVQDNIFNQGNIPGYTLGIVDKIGQERVDKLMMSRHNLSKMSKFEVEYLIKEYKEKIKDLNLGTELAEHK